MMAWALFLSMLSGTFPSNNASYFSLLMESTIVAREAKTALLELITR
jgi:hypothetical protein